MSFVERTSTGFGDRTQRRVAANTTLRSSLVAPLVDIIPQAPRTAAVAAPFVAPTGGVTQAGVSRDGTAYSQALQGIAEYAAQQAAAPAAPAVPRRSVATARNAGAGGSAPQQSTGTGFTPSAPINAEQLIAQNGSYGPYPLPAPGPRPDVYTPQWINDKYAAVREPNGPVRVFEGMNPQVLAELIRDGAQIPLTDDQIRRTLNGEVTGLYNGQVAPAFTAASTQPAPAQATLAATTAPAAQPSGSTGPGSVPITAATATTGDLSSGLRLDLAGQGLLPEATFRTFDGQVVTATQAGAPQVELAPNVTLADNGPATQADLERLGIAAPAATPQPTSAFVRATPTPQPNLAPGETRPIYGANQGTPTPAPTSAFTPFDENGQGGSAPQPQSIQAVLDEIRQRRELLAAEAQTLVSLRDQLDADIERTRAAVEQAKAELAESQRQNGTG